MKIPDHKFTGMLFEWGGKGSWHFITVPEDTSGIIRMSCQKRTGFGSVRVVAEISGISWKTSLFPDSKSGCYLLPIKAEIRSRANLQAGVPCKVGLSLID
jgi:Domain of unknown function (DUF1905)